MVGVLPGIDRRGIEAWVRADRLALEPPLRFERIAGGRSNLTYLATDATGARVILRRPPLHSTLPGAHDMRREVRVLRALQDTEVPVPRVLGSCADPAVTGAPFYVMDLIEGLVLRSSAEARAHLSRPARRAVSRGLVDSLAALHAITPAAVGLADLGRPGGYVIRQLGGWMRRWREGGGRSLGIVGEVHDRLARHVPDQQRVSIVHGDYRLDNTIVTAQGAVRGVIDWELCTLGDPLADLGLLLAYWTPGAVGDPPTSAPGFATEADLVGWYAEESALDVGDVAYYLAFSLWRVAVILEGVAARHRSGAYGEHDDEVHTMPQRVDELLARSWDVLRTSVRTSG